MSQQLAHRTRIEKPDKEAALKLLNARRKRLATDFEFVGSTEEGRRVLRHIAGICGYHKTCVGGNPQLGMDILQGTFYNAARQGVYVELRALMTSRLLKQIEFNPIEEIE